jgi:hypothetical protein
MCREGRAGLEVLAASIGGTIALGVWRVVVALIEWWAR